jgi:hypothetical protein
MSFQWLYNNESTPPLPPITVSDLLPDLVTGIHRFKKSFGQKYRQLLNMCPATCNCSV